MTVCTIPDTNELAELNEADISSLTNEGIQALVDYFNSFSTENNVTPMKKTAIYAHTALNFGLS